MPKHTLPPLDPVATRAGRTARIVLVDDHAVVRAGFRMLLATCDTVSVIAEASRGEQAVRLYQDLGPDLMVMDLSMPGMGGLETIRRIVHHDAAAAILVFSVHHEQVYVERALAAGARGYITKNSAPTILIEAIDTIMHGRRYVEQGLAGQNGRTGGRAAYQELVAGFSVREFDVFRLLAQGMTVSRIADRLCLGNKTVANYATAIRKKLGIETGVQLAQIATELGLLDKAGQDGP